MIQLFQQSEGTAAQRRIYFQAVDATDGVSAETGLTGTGYVSKNGGTPAATTNSLTEISSSNMPGRYYLELTATELDTVGMVEFRYKAAACAEVVARGQVVPWDPYDSVRLGMTALPNAAAEAAGGLYTRGAGAGQINQSASGQVDVNVEQWRDSVPNTLQTGRVDSYGGAMAADVLTASALATDAVNEIRDAILSDSTAFAGANIDATVSSRATPTQVNTEVDTALADIHLDHLLAVDYDPAVKPGVATALLNELVESDGGVSRFTSNALEQLWQVTLSELSQAKPAATPSASAAVMLLYMALRNKEDQSDSSYELHNDAGTVICKAALSEASGVVTKAEMETGP